MSRGEEAATMEARTAAHTLHCIHSPILQSTSKPRAVLPWRSLHKQAPLSGSRPRLCTAEPVRTKTEAGGKHPENVCLVFPPPSLRETAFSYEKRLPLPSLSSIQRHRCIDTGTRGVLAPNPSVKSPHKFITSTSPPVQRAPLCNSRATSQKRRRRSCRLSPQRANNAAV